MVQNWIIFISIVDISISTRRFWKISISIKYRINQNLAYRKGLLAALPVPLVAILCHLFCTFDTLLQLGWCPCFAAEKSLNWPAENKISKIKLWKQLIIKILQAMWRKKETNNYRHHLLSQNPTIDPKGLHCRW